MINVKQYTGPGKAATPAKNPANVQLALFSICIQGCGLMPNIAVCAEKETEPVEVVITESARLATPLYESPFAAGVIDEPLKNRQGVGLDEALFAVPGVYAQNRYNAAQDVRIAIRGFGARSNFGVRGIKIIVDGVPHTLPDGQAQLDSIDLASIDRIEVRRGPSSALYGNASGGVIDIRTKFDEATNLSGQAVLGEFGYQNYVLRAAAQYKRWAGVANAVRTHLDGFRAHSARQSDLINTQMRWRTPHGDWAVLLNSLDAPLALDPGGLTRSEARTDPHQASARNVSFNAGETVTQQKAAITYRKDLAADQELRLRAYGIDRDFANRLPFQNGGTVVLERKFFGWGAEWRGSLQTGAARHTYVLGIDIDDQDDDRQRFDNLLGLPGPEVFNQKERVRSVGVFFQNEFNFGTATNFVLGVRFDTVRFKVVDQFLTDGDDSGRRNFDHFSPMFGVSWAALDNIQLYANVATSFETPTTTELANPGGGGFNPALQPQSATNYELGMKLQNKHVAASLAIFHIDVKDELVPFELPQSPGRSFFRNAGRSARDGVEASLNWRFQQNWLLTLAYTFSDFVFDQFRTEGNILDGNRTPGIPRHLLDAQIRFQHPSGLFASGDLRFVGSQFADDGNLVEVDSYGTAGLRAGIEKGLDNWNLKLFTGVNNITNEKYFDNVRINAAADRYFEPAAKRNFYVGVVVTRVFP